MLWTEDPEVAALRDAGTQPGPEVLPPMHIALRVDDEPTAADLATIEAYFREARSSSQQLDNSALAGAQKQLLGSGRGAFLTMLRSSGYSLEPLRKVLCPPPPAH